MKSPYVAATKAEFCLALSEESFSSLRNQRCATLIHGRAQCFFKAFKSVSADILESLVSYRRLQQECGIADEKANGSTRDLAGRLSNCWTSILGPFNDDMDDIPEVHSHSNKVFENLFNLCECGAG